MDLDPQNSFVKNAQTAQTDFFIWKMNDFLGQNQNRQKTSPDGFFYRNYLTHKHIHDISNSNISIIVEIIRSLSIY